MTHTLPFRFVRPCIVGPTGQAGASLDPGPRMVRWTGGRTLYPIPSPGSAALGKLGGHHMNELQQGMSRPLLQKSLSQIHLTPHFLAFLAQ